MNIAEYERLRFERRDHGVLLITMDRPDKYLSLIHISEPTRPY